MILEESNNIFNDSGASLVGICTPLNHEFEPSARGPVYASFEINPSKISSPSSSSTPSSSLEAKRIHTSFHCFAIDGS